MAGLLWPHYLRLPGSLNWREEVLSWVPQCASRSSVLGQKRNVLRILPALADEAEG